MSASSSSSSSPGILTINSRTFYHNYYGVKIDQLEQVLANLQAMDAENRVVYLAGDSSLDNKHWLLGSWVPAAPPYDRFLDPPRSTPDVAHWLNRALHAGGHLGWAAV